MTTREVLYFEGVRVLDSKGQQVGEATIDANGHCTIKFTPEAWEYWKSRMVGDLGSFSIGYKREA